MVIKGSLGHFGSYSRQMQEIAWRVERAQMSSLKTKLFLKYWGHRPCTHFLTSFRMCSSRLSKTWPLHSFHRSGRCVNYNLPKRFCRVSRIPVFTSPQHPQSWLKFGIFVMLWSDRHGYCDFLLRGTSVSLVLDGRGGAVVGLSSTRNAYWILNWVMRGFENKFILGQL